MTGPPATVSLGFPGLQYGLLLTALAMTWLPAGRPLIVAYRIQCLLVILAIAAPFLSNPRTWEWEALPEWPSTLMLLVVLLGLLVSIETILSYAVLGRRPTTPQERDKVRFLWAQADVAGSPDTPTTEEASAGPEADGRALSTARRARHGTAEVGFLSGRRIRDWTFPLIITVAAMLIARQTRLADESLPIALGLILLGAYNATRRDDISRVLGILTADHGLFLLAAPRGALFELAIIGYTVFTLVVLAFLLPAVYGREFGQGRERLASSWAERIVRLTLIPGGTFGVATLFAVMSNQGDLSLTTKFYVVSALVLLLYSMIAGFLSADRSTREDPTWTDKMGWAFIVVTVTMMSASFLDVIAFSAALEAPGSHCWSSSVPIYLFGVPTNVTIKCLLYHVYQRNWHSGRYWNKALRRDVY
jgi:hypothetical protein